MSDQVLAGRYRLEGRLGGGGMGTVWRAVDETLRRTVAVKEIVFPDVLTAEERRVATGRAQREARAAALIDHPGVITVHDVVIEDERPWIVMELVDGPSLAEVIRRDGPLAPAAAAGIGLKVLDALEAAHAKGIVHRDVKPGNVLLAGDGRVVLTDFGIASIDADPSLTRTGTFVGTPGYVAPERLRERPGGPESDLWSLGATLYAAVEGRAPFDRDTPMAVLGAVLTEEPAPPQRAGSLGPLLWYLLRKEPSTRPGAEEVRRVLRNVAAGLPSGLPSATPSATPSGPPFGPPGAVTTPAPPGRRPSRIWIPVAASAAVVMVGALLAGIILMNGPDGEAEVSASARADASSPPASPEATPTPTPSEARLDLCGLVGHRQLKRLLPRGNPSVEKDQKSCGWTVSKRGFEITDLNRRTSDPPPASPAEAHNKFVGTRNATTPGTHVWGWPTIDVDHVKARKSGALPVSGIGDEAFAYTSTGLTKPMDISGVVFRVENTLIEVEHVYERGTASPGDARDAARLIARAVARA